ncbi:MAG: methyltransferase domain-containing protein [Acidimicrobiales bacterium]
MNEAADRWARELADWAIPPEILDRAPQEPFVFPPQMFAAPPADDASPSLSTRLAREALVDGGSVLDIGCGGGAAAFAVAPPATHLIGTDRQPDMTDLFARTAEERGISHETYPGSWPEVAPSVPTADVVVSNNVLYNVASRSGGTAARATGPASPGSVAGRPTTRWR